MRAAQWAAFFLRCSSAACRHDAAPSAWKNSATPIFRSLHQAGVAGQAIAAIAFVR